MCYVLSLDFSVSDIFESHATLGDKDLDLEIDTKWSPKMYFPFLSTIMPWILARQRAAPSSLLSSWA